MRTFCGLSAVLLAVVRDAVGARGRLLATCTALVVFGFPLLVAVSPRFNRVAVDVFVVLLALAAVAAWVGLVAGVLVQNTPRYARLVPGHARLLRWLLVCAWLLLASIGALGAAVLARAPASGVAMVGGLGLGAFAVMRWQRLVWPLVILYALRGVLLHMPGLERGTAWLADAWMDWPTVFIMAGAALGVVLLSAGVGRGGSRHAHWHAVVIGWRARGRSVSPEVDVPRRMAATSGIELHSGLMGAWVRAAARRPGRGIVERALLGLGPVPHWLRDIQLPALLATVALAAALLMGSRTADLKEIVAGLGALFAIALITSTSGGLRRGLHRTRREQALLMLLPGMPRGGAFNRALGARLLINFVAMQAASCLLFTAALGVLEFLLPEPGRAPIWLAPCYVFVVTAPLAARLLRHWATDARPGALSALPHLLLVIALAVALFAGAVLPRLLAPFVVAYLLAPCAWCAWHLYRARREPSAFPVGRLGRIKD